MKSFFILLFLLYNSITLSAIKLHGEIIDAKTSEPISFVNIGIKGTRYGTASNSAGTFVLNVPEQHKNGVLQFSCIGFETRELPVHELLSQHVVRLEPSVVPLDEVTVMPDSTLRSFLRRAARKIPENYTSSSSLLTGFYRQTLQDENDETNLRFVEVLIESYKTSYADKMEGTVKVLKTRKYISGRDFFPSFFYGGAHIAHFDMVKDRSKVLIGHKNYNYRVLGIKGYNNRKVYEIEFFPAEESRSTLLGRFYLDVETLAYVQIDHEHTQKGLDKRSRSPALRGIKAIYSGKSVAYDQLDGRYYLKSIHGSEIFLDSDSNEFSLGYEYVTTHLSSENVSKTAFNEQIGQMYTPSLEAVDYRDSDWKDYNILAFPGTMNLVDTLSGNRLLCTEAKFREPIFKKIMTALLKSEFGYNLRWMDVSAPGGNYSLSCDELLFQKERERKDGTMLIHTHMGYRLNNHLYIAYQSSGNLDKDFFLRQHFWGGRFYLPLKTTGDQILFNIDGGWSWQNMGISLGEANSEESFTFGGKKIKADRVHAYTGLRQCGFKVGSGLSYQISSRYHLEIGGGYLFPVVE